MRIRLIGTEIDLVSANSFENNRLIRIYNDSGGAATITRRDDANNIIGACTLATDEVAVFDKDNSDTLESTANVTAVAIGYTP